MSRTRRESRRSRSRVADELGVRSPSLYSHVDGLAGLRRGVAIDAVRRLGEALHAAMQRAERDRTRSARSLTRTASSRSRTRGVYALLQRTPPREDDAEVYDVFAAVADSLVGAVAAAGVPEDDAVACIRVLRSALHGFVSLEVGGGFGLPVDVDASFDLLVASSSPGSVGTVRGHDQRATLSPDGGRRHGGDRGDDGGPRVPVNVYETSGALVVLAPLPAVTADDVTVELRPGALRFWAHLRSAGPREFVLHEWDYGGYEREIDLPAGYGSGVEASLINGQLAIRVLPGDGVAQTVTPTRTGGG